MVSRKITNSASDVSSTSASEAILKSKEAGAVAAFDRVPFSYLSANFTFNTDNCVSIFEHISLCCNVDRNNCFLFPENAAFIIICSIGC